jgi:hypothetical protein
MKRVMQPERLLDFFPSLIFHGQAMILLIRTSLLTLRVKIIMVYIRNLEYN